MKKPNSNLLSPQSSWIPEIIKDLSLVKVEEQGKEQASIAIFYNETKIGLMPKHRVVCLKSFNMMIYDTKYGIEWALYPYEVLIELDFKNIQSTTHAD